MQKVSSAEFLGWCRRGWADQAGDEIIFPDIQAEQDDPGVYSVQTRMWLGMARGRKGKNGMKAHSTHQLLERVKGTT